MAYYQTRRDLSLYLGARIEGLVKCIHQGTGVSTYIYIYIYIYIYSGSGSASDFIYSVYLVDHGNYINVLCCYLIVTWSDKTSLIAKKHTCLLNLVYLLLHMS